MTAMFGGSSAAANEAKAQAAASQRTQLAQLASQQAQVDQEKSSGSRTKGRRLLTFLGGDGNATLG